MSEVYRKFGSVVRREGEALMRVVEGGEAIDDGRTFVVRPVAGPMRRDTTDPLDPVWRTGAPPVPLPVSAAVVSVAGRLAALRPERLIVSEGVAEHECDGRVWREESRRVHVALTHGTMRVLADHADFDHLDEIETIARALRDVGEERKVARVRLAPAVTASLLPSLIDTIEIEQMAGERDGRGHPIGRRLARPPHPNVFRPTYRVRPIAMPFNLRAVPFGTLDPDAPLAIAIVNSTSLLCVEAGRSFLAPLRLDHIAAVGEADRWYPYAAGSFGAEILVENER